MAATLSQAIGQAVRNLRNNGARKLTTRVVAERMTELGLGITPQRVTQIEGGGGGRISLEQWLALSYALDAPPLALVARETTEQNRILLGAREVGLLDLEQWLLARRPLAGQDEEMFRAQSPVTLLFGHLRGARMDTTLLSLDEAAGAFMDAIRDDDGTRIALTGQRLRDLVQAVETESKRRRRGRPAGQQTVSKVSRKSAD